MTDLDARIVAALVSGLSERQVSRRLSCTVGQIRAALDRRAARMLDPDAVLRSLANGVARLTTIERTSGDARMRQRARRQRARQAKVILQRAPRSRPM